MEDRKPLAELPEWVPPVMATHYRRILSGEDGTTWKEGPYGGGYGLLAEYGYPKHQLAPTVSKLCTNPEMEAVWRRLGNAFDGAPGPRWSWEGNLFYYLLWALFARSPWDALTPAQREKKHGEITNRLNELAALLREYELDRTIWEFIQPKEFEGAIERHFYTAFTAGYQDSDLEGRDDPALFLCSNPPHVSGLLERLGQAITTEKVHEVALVERDRGHGRDYIIFARRMGSYFNEFLGGPRYETVAALARVLLGVDVDEDTVRKTISGAPHDKERMFNLWE